jgi:hypothetical protein
MSAQLDKVRAKGRANRASIDGSYHGKMPVFNPTEKVEDDQYWNIWGQAANWFNYACKPKDFRNYSVSYAKDTLKFSKEDIHNLKKLSDNAFLPISKLVAVSFTGFPYKQEELDRISDALTLLVSKGKLIADEEKAEEDNQPEKVVVSPQYRMFLKMMETVYAEFDDVVVEGWSNGDFKTKWDAFKSLKSHDVKGAAVKMLSDRVEKIRNEMKDAYDKVDQDIVDAYSHIKRSNLKKAVEQLNTILADIEKAQLASKAVRKPRASKAKASDKQVAKMKFLKEDNDSKLASINPIQIPGAFRLYVYNVKQRKLFEYVTDNDKGFEVSGSTLKNVDEKLSRSTRLRKPDDVLPMVLKKTPRQIDNMFNGLTTKVEVPNGRINKDCILLRVLDK